MRGISLAIFIQKLHFMDNQILTDASDSISVDKEYLPEHLKDKSVNKKIWLWHLPFGVSESDIKDHFLQTGFWKSDMNINKLYDRYEKKFAGYEIDCPEGFNLKKYVDERKLPPGQD